jgi:hypothetical protein
MLKDEDMMVRIFEVTFDKFNMVAVCTDGNYAQELITTLYNY